MHKITVLHSSSVLLFAAEELRTTLNRICSAESSCSIQLGLFSDFSLCPKGDNPILDDEIAIQIQNGNGYIAGSNERSVLFAVYRYLETCGVAWVRPGKDGTVYPSNIVPTNCFLQEAASTRYRVVCIEGAVSIQHVLNMIDWIPKLGFNGYFIQFRTAYIFFDRWYSHRRSTVKSPEPFDDEQAAEYVATMKKEIKRRGLQLHTMGHGWTCEPFGIFNYGWDPVPEKDIPENYRSLCAQVNGVRDVWMHKPIATQLCYSNPDARRIMNEGVLSYIRENPDVDVLHYWLGDYFNNYCECPDCRKLHVSDLYIRLLNELDEMLTKENLSTKIVFGISNNKGYLPLQEKLKHPERFVLMFAPISRTFSQAFPKEFRCTKTPEYEINNYSMPSSVDENLAFLYQWEQYYSGDCIDFDYHLMWDHFLDAGAEDLSAVLHQDLQNLKSLGMNGFISCQLQRNAFPTSLVMTVMGKTLWNRASDFGQIRNVLYQQSFGEESLPLLKEYFRTLSRGMNIGVLRSHKKVLREEAIQNLQDALLAMEQFGSVISAQRHSDPCVARSWRNLELHRQIYIILGRSLLARFHRRNEEADLLLQKTIEFVWEHEDELDDVMDGYFYQECVQAHVDLEKPASFLDSL